jgi:(p)ppGpp synthase/HD superfamily hydrolase
VTDEREQSRRATYELWRQAQRGRAYFLLAGEPVRVDWHGGQTRPAGEPYLEHLLEATRVLVEAVGVTDVDVLRAAVPHDVVEDTACTLDEVRDRFGDRVAHR